MSGTVISITNNTEMYLNHQEELCSSFQNVFEICPFLSLYMNTLVSPSLHHCSARWLQQPPLWSLCFCSSPSTSALSHSLQESFYSPILCPFSLHQKKFNLYTWPLHFTDEKNNTLQIKWLVQRHADSYQPGWPESVLLSAMLGLHCPLTAFGRHFFLWHLHGSTLFNNNSYLYLFPLGWQRNNIEGQAWGYLINIIRPQSSPALALTA